MKKTVLNLALVFSLMLSSVFVTASEKNPVVASDKPASDISVETRILMNRLEEIKEMDKSDLKSSEKKELRREVREIKRELKGKGIYLSTGAIIIIVLLILLL